MAKSEGGLIGVAIVILAILASIALLVYTSERPKLGSGGRTTTVSGATATDSGGGGATAAGSGGGGGGAATAGSGGGGGGAASTGAGGSSAPPPALNDDESRLKELFDTIGPILRDAGIAVAGALTLSKAYDLLTNPEETIKSIRKAIRNTPRFLRSIKASTARYLTKVSMRFRLFFTRLFSMNAEDFLRLAKKIGMYLPKTLARIGRGATAIYNFLRSGARIGAAATALASRAAKAASNALKGLAAAGAQALRSITPFDIAMLGLMIAGTILDEENTAKMQDWRKFKTSDFLSYKEEMISQQIEGFREIEEDFVYPFIVGPFEKFTPAEQSDIMFAIITNLLCIPYIPTGTSYLSSTTMNSNPALKNTYRYFFTTSGQVNAETHPMIQQLRAVQDRALKRYYDAASTNPPNPLPALYYTTMFTRHFLELFSEDSTEGQADLEILNRVAGYAMCLELGGNPLSSGFCSYSNPSDCFNSHPYPFKSVDESFVAGFGSPIPDSTGICPSSPSLNARRLSSMTSSSPNPNAGVSPCLSIEDDIGKGDEGFYAEWREPNFLRMEYGSGSYDYTSDPNARGGVCILANPGIRMLCDATTKADDSAGANFDGTVNTDYRVIGTNRYNPFTGECFNEKSFCDAFGIQYDPSRPTGLLGQHPISGPLPSCYQSQEDRAWAIILGGSSIIQYINIGIRQLREGFCQIFNRGNCESDARQREQQRVFQQLSIQASRSDLFQIQQYQNYYGFSFMANDENFLSLVDFKVDVFGGVYLLYAYGIEDGVLQLIKLNNRFEIDTTGGWSQNTIFPFSGSVVNTANCKIALDEYGNFYMIETFQDTNTGNLRQKIVKRYPDGNYDRSTWKEISANRYWDRTRKYRDENFNGIFIRNGNLYVTYTGYDDTANIALSKFLKHRLDLVDDSLTEVIAGNNYLGADAEIFSFVVDDNETHYSMNNNLKYGSTSQIVLTAYFRNGTNRRYNINTDPFFTDPVFDILGANPVVVSRPSITLVDPAFQARWDTLFPKICIDTYNQIFIGNGVRIIRVNLDASNNIVLPVIPSDKSETVTRFLDAGTSRQVPEYLRGPSGITVIRRAAYWERSHLTIDEAGDLYSIYYAKAIVKFNIKRSLGESRYVLCKQLRQLLPDDGIPRDFTATSVELWVDGVNFVGPSFSETCIGVENVYIDFPGRMYPVSSFDVLHQRSAAQTVGSDIGLNTGRIRGSGSSVYVIIGTGDTVNTCRNAVTNNVLTLPTNAGRMLVDPIVGDGVPVNIDFKINRDIIRSYTLTFDTTNFFIRNTLRIDDDSSSFDVLSFNEPVYAYGCRTLYMEIRNSSGQSVIGPDKLIVYVRSTSVKIPNRLQFNQTYTITLSFPRFSSINHSFTYTPSPRYYAFYPRNVIHIIKFVSATQIESSLIRLTGSDVNADPSPTRKYTAQCRQLYNYTVNGNDYNISVSTSVLILCDGQETRTGVTTNSYGTLLQSTGTRTARYNSSNDEFSLDMWNNINRPTQCSTESSEWFNLSRPLTYKRLIVPSIGC